MPGTDTYDGAKPPIHEQISELQRKIQLLDGDRKAFYESLQWTIKKNKESILWLRQENKKLHQKLADVLTGDEKVIQEAFQNRAVERAAMRSKSGQTAIQLVDQKLCDKMKRLNALRHRADVRRRRLAELQSQCKQREPGAQEGTSQEAQIEAAEQEEIPHQTIRVLENRLEKAQLKLQESEHIHSVYLQLKEHMQEESLTFQSQLDLLEAEILHQKHELSELHTMNRDAMISRDVARAELQRQEDQVYKERRERERVLQSYRAQAEERRENAERAERRAQRVALQGEEVPSDTQVSAGQEEERVIRTFQEAFSRIKEATGVTDTQEVVRRFIAQGDTHRHLEQLKSENERTLVRLKEEKEALQEAFQGMKYSGDTRLSRGQQVLEQLRSHLLEEEKRRDKAKEEQERLSRFLSTAKSGVEQLASKVQHVTVPKSRFPAAPDLFLLSDENILDLLSVTEEKLQKLLEELGVQDLGDALKQMEEEEFQASIEGRLPAYNVRITLPTPAKADIYDDDEDSSDDEGDVVTRAALKRQSQQIVESKTKRRTRTKKKKGKQ
ncbi:LOW QUALITY PROTEIN: outer dynein arm-docking complex subunit 3 [Ascaphus truei]|uniref:LOW QUALITY PROTEIN: outer dynein arm-docking complex subunit 3 n=1 Tax=Ascaphus truei TaxID=8439 RepID=UPI003F5A9A8C